MDSESKENLSDKKMEIDTIHQPDNTKDLCHLNAKKCKIDNSTEEVELLNGEGVLHDVLHEVFKYLNAQELCISAAVCR